MKQRFIPVLLTFCLLLSACGASAVENRYKSFSQDLAGEDSLSFTGRLQAEYEDRSLSFTLLYEKTPAGCTVTVREPELLAGIRARLSGDASSLEYDGLVIDTGDLDAYGLSPLSALPTLVRALEGGHLESYREEDGLSVLQLILDDHLYAQVAFQPETMVPVRAELVSDGRVTVKCEIEDWKT